MDWITKTVTTVPNFSLRKLYRNNCSEMDQSFRREDGQKISLCYKDQAWQKTMLQSFTLHSLHAYWAKSAPQSCFLCPLRKKIHSWGEYFSGQQVCWRNPCKVSCSYRYFVRGPVIYLQATLLCMSQRYHSIYSNHIRHQLSGMTALWDPGASRFYESTSAFQQD